jgi:two-component system, LuxR family, response regulator FixJ
MMPRETAGREIVFLVDDDAAVLTSIGRLLASDGFAVRSFSEPGEFLAHVETNPVPLVILDVWMEQMTGLEVQAKLARISPKTRVIVMTGRKDPGAEKTAMDFGAVAFFLKPFDDEEFLAAVHRALAPRTEDESRPLS